MKPTYACVNSPHNTWINGYGDSQLKAPITTATPVLRISYRWTGEESSVRKRQDLSLMLSSLRCSSRLIFDTVVSLVKYLWTYVGFFMKLKRSRHNTVGLWAASDGHLSNHPHVKRPLGYQGSSFTGHSGYPEPHALFSMASHTVSCPPSCFPILFEVPVLFPLLCTAFPFLFWSQKVSHTGSRVWTLTPQLAALLRRLWNLLGVHPCWRLGHWDGSWGFCSS